MTTERPVPASSALLLLRRRVGLFAVLLVATVIVAELPLPFRLAGLAFGTATIWVGIVTLVQMARVRKLGEKPRGQVAVSAGLGLTAVLMFMLFAQAAFYPLVADLEQCLAAANTNTAQQDCHDADRDRREDIMQRLRERTGG